jgi:hypothetical protein
VVNEADSADMEAAGAAARAAGEVGCCFFCCASYMLLYLWHLWDSRLLACRGSLITAVILTLSERGVRYRTLPTVGSRNVR